MIRRLVIIMLIMTVLVPAVPFRNACDVDWNNRIDLIDVVANMQSLVRSTGERHDFGDELGKAISSIRNVAGLDRAVITDDGSARVAGWADHVYLVSFIDLAPIMTAISSIGDSPVPYQSIETPVIHGPPKGRA